MGVEVPEGCGAGGVSKLRKQSRSSEVEPMVLLLECARLGKVDVVADPSAGQSF